MVTNPVNGQAFAERREQIVNSLAVVLLDYIP